MKLYTHNIHEGMYGYVFTDAMFFKPSRCDIQMRVQRRPKNKLKESNLDKRTCRGRSSEGQLRCITVYPGVHINILISFAINFALDDIKHNKHFAKQSQFFLNMVMIANLDL